MGAGRRAGQGPGIMPKNILTTLAPSVGVPHFYLLDVYIVNASFMAFFQDPEPYKLKTG